eukprot:227929-Rhodomonas_salina.2
MLLDQGSGRVGKNARGVTQVPDRGVHLAARRALHKVDGRLDLRAHRARKLLACLGAEQVLGRDLAHLARVGLAEVLPDPSAVGQDNEHVGVELVRQQRAAVVLVDHRFHAPQRARFVVSHRHAPPAARDGHQRHGRRSALGVEERSHGLQLQDLKRLRRRHHSAVVRAVGLDDPPVLGRQRLSLVLRVDRAH